MDIPVFKNKRWVESLHNSLDQFDEELKAAVLKPAGASCASDILLLCEDHLGHDITSVQDLVNGWNTLRESRKLEGGWQFENDTVHGIFHECGCPLVRSGLVELHPNQCLCSMGMVETAFTKAAKKEVEVILKRSIGNGDRVCEFLVKF